MAVQHQKKHKNKTVRVPEAPAGEPKRRSTVWFSMAGIAFLMTIAAVLAVWAVNRAGEPKEKEYPESPAELRTNVLCGAIENFCRTAELKDPGFLAVDWREFEGTDETFREKLETALKPYADEILDYVAVRDTDRRFSFDEEGRMSCTGGWRLHVVYDDFDYEYAAHIEVTALRGPEKDQQIQMVIGASRQEDGTWRYFDLTDDGKAPPVSPAPSASPAAQG